MAYQDIEESRMYKRAEEVADVVWDMVIKWDKFAKNTVGEQLVRSTDSIGANIAESSGRHHQKDIIRFLHFSRGSLRETRFWLRRAIKRHLIPPETHQATMQELTQLGKELNSYIRYQRNRTIKESPAEYNTD
jgi:four helix bundle protein